MSIGDPGVLRAIFGGGLYLAMLGLFSLALGGIIRHTAAGITGVIGFILVLSPLAQLIPGNLGDHIHAYLPSQAGQLIAQAVQAPERPAQPVAGLRRLRALDRAAPGRRGRDPLKRRDA